MIRNPKSLQKNPKLKYHNSRHMECEATSGASLQPVQSQITSPVSVIWLCRLGSSPLKAVVMLVEARPAGCHHAMVPFGFGKDWGKSPHGEASLAPVSSKLCIGPAHAEVDGIGVPQHPVVYHAIKIVWVNP